MKRSNLNSVPFLIIGTLLGILISGLFFLLFANPRSDVFGPAIEHVDISVTPSISQNLILCHLPAVPGQTKIDLNTASIDEFDTLPGIGEVKSKAIIDYRQKYGNFVSINELLYVQGISESLFQKFCNLIVISP
jgi:competence ComEA-like helix-hairpin-helix protein